jgi:Hint domain
MGEWIALSDRGSPLNGADPVAILPRGAFVMELMLPLAGPTVLLDYAEPDGRSGFSIFFDPQRGLILLQRQGRRLLRHTLPDPFAGDAGLRRVVFTWDILARRWTLCADAMDDTPPRRAEGTDPVAWSVADIVALCHAGQRHANVLWYGLTTGDAPPRARPWIGRQTPLETPNGPVAAGLLQAGDLVLTQDSGPLPVRFTLHPEVPGRGAFAPILLRAPYFGRTTDLLVSREQPICMSGTSVDYLFGEDRVLAAADQLVDGIAAYPDNRRSVVTGVVLDFGRPALVMADGCVLLMQSDPPGPLPARILQQFEVTPLMAMQTRAGLRTVA